ncbi:MAG: cytochrome c assembly protein, partial [bacterium]
MTKRRPLLDWLPHVLLGLCLLYVASHLRPPHEGAFRLNAFGKLPVQDLGRVKPIDTLARTSLMVISNRQVFWLAGEDGTSSLEDMKGHKKTGATQWLLDVIGRPQQ